MTKPNQPTHERTHQIKTQADHTDARTPNTTHVVSCLGEHEDTLDHLKDGTRISIGHRLVRERLDTSLLLHAFRRLLGELVQAMCNGGVTLGLQQLLHLVVLLDIHGLLFYCLLSLYIYNIYIYIYIIYIIYTYT